MNRTFLDTLAENYGGKYVSPSDTHYNYIERTPLVSAPLSLQETGEVKSQNFIPTYPDQMDSRKLSIVSSPVIQQNLLSIQSSYSESASWGVQREKWMWRKNDKNNTDTAYVSKLSGSTAFSESFSQIFARNSYIDVTDPNNDEKSIFFFAALVETAATQKFYTGKYYVPIKLCENFKAICNFYMNEQNILSWKPTSGSVHCGTWLEMLQCVLNINWLDATATLAKMVGIDFVNMTQLTSKQYAPETTGSTGLQNNIPRLLANTADPTGENSFCLERFISIRGHSGQVIGGFSVYKWGDKTLYVPAIGAGGTLSIGEHKATAHFLNQDKLDKYLGKPVIFFANLRVALEIQALIGESRNKIPDVIIVAHLGNNLDLLPWNCLFTHPIIFVPDTTKISLAFVKRYAKFCNDSHIPAFSVAKYFVALGFRKDVLEITSNELTTPEQYILDNSIWLDEEEYPQTVITRLQKSSQSFDEFENLWKQMGVFKDNQNVQEESKREILSPLPKEMKPPKPQDVSDVNCLHLIRFGANIMVVGMKNAGKTQISYISISALLGKINLPWPFSKNNFQYKGNICLIDGETPDDELMENMEQHGLSSDIGKRLFLFSTMGRDNPEWFEEHTINDEEFRKALTDFLIENNCRLLILDNMKALMGDKVGQPYAVQKIMDWIRELQRIDICVEYLLHKDEDAPATSKDKNKGAAAFRELARVIINVIGRDEIEVLADCPKEVSAIAKKNGLSCALKFPTCKTAPMLQDLTIWLHLPFGIARWETICITDIDGNKVAIPDSYKDNISNIPSYEDSKVIDVDYAIMQSPFDFSTLSEKARILYEKMNEHPDHEWTIGELEKEFSKVRGMGRDTIRDKYLAELMNAHLVERIGNDLRNIRYKII